MQTDSEEYSQLIWSILAATIIVVGLTMLGGGSPTRGGARTALTPVRDPVFVELRYRNDKPAVYRLGPDAKLWDVFRAAGIAPPEGSDTYRPMESGEVVTVSLKGEVTTGVMDGAKLVALGVKIPLRTASSKDIESIPGIGKALSRRILKYLATAGSVDSWQDLAKVKGVGSLTLERLRRYTRL
ncbi:MAG: hypothetical protein GXP54_00890 [Deltaproteobacteria bacterium]|nr:hypothetical protein [Deltaproteobacteria bacterium]